MNATILLSLGILAVLVYLLFSSRSGGAENITDLSTQETIASTSITESKSSEPTYTHMFNIYVKTYPDSSSNIISRSAGSAHDDDSFLICYEPTLSNLVVEIKNDQSSYNKSSVQIPKQKWVNIAVVVHPYSIEIYMNGTLVKSTFYYAKNHSNNTLYNSDITIGDGSWGAENAWIYKYYYVDSALGINDITSEFNSVMAEGVSEESQNYALSLHLSKNNKNEYTLFDTSSWFDN